MFSRLASSSMEYYHYMQHKDDLDALLYESECSDDDADLLMPDNHIETPIYCMPALFEGNNKVLGYGIVQSSLQSYRPVQDQFNEEQARKVASGLLANHLTSRGNASCDCLSEFLQKKTENIFCDVFVSCRRYMALLNKNGEASRRDAIKHFLYGRQGMAKRGKHEFGYYALGFHHNTGSQEIIVCKAVFMAAYDMSKHTLTKIHQEIKQNSFKKISPLNDRTKHSSETYSRLRKETTATETEIANDLQMDEPNFRTMLLPNSEHAKWACAWMKDHFETIGDSDPTSNEIQLEKTEKLKVYLDYKNFCEANFIDECLDYAPFTRLWTKCFPHVKIREYKSVTGKCSYCAALSDLRCRTQNRETLRAIRDFHALHKVTYMNERMLYRQRAIDAMNYPDQFMSIIMDGMAQQHTELPYLGGMDTAKEKLSMHLMGVIEHGQQFVMYRSYENVQTGANKAIHCLLSQLESRIHRKGKLPPIIYIQIDGGSENANSSMLAICELLVSKRLTEKIILTRLPVGHTHEDIDAKFGKFSQLVQGRSIMSPQEYEQALRGCFGTAGNFEVVDIFCVPSYTTLLKAAVDSKFSKAFKEHQSQLTWKFESVDVDPIHFPLGVKTSYKKYSSNEVYELHPYAEIEALPYEVRKTLCSYWYPCVGFPPGNTHDGMRILTRIPKGFIFPAEFVPGHTETFRVAMNAIKKSSLRTKAYRDWEVFRESYPAYESSMDYLTKPSPSWIRGPGPLQTAQLHFPLREKLFPDSVPFQDFQFFTPDRNAATINSVNAAPVAFIRQRSYMSLPSVVWSETGRGNVETPDLFIPPTLEISQLDLERVMTDNEFLATLIYEHNKKPLNTKDAYEECTVEELKSRVLARKLGQKLEAIRKQKAKGTLVKSDYVRVLLEDDNPALALPQGAASGASRTTASSRLLSRIPVLDPRIPVPMNVVDPEVEVHAEENGEEEGDEDNNEEEC